MELIKEQATNFENIKTICNNYRKDSATRKTVDYLENRISKLEKEWVTFHERHEVLVEKIEDKSSINYFTSDIYGKTKQLYDATKQNMTEMLVAHRQPTKLEFDLTGMLVEETEDKLKDLLNTQEANFKALARAMSKVDIEVMKEKWEFEDHLSILKSKWEAVDKLHWQLETALKGSSLKTDYESRFEDLEQKYDNLRGLLSSKNWSNIHYQRSAPRIQIPEFSGDYIQWLSFKDIFTETVHNNPTISNCQKMQYLKTKLKGEPERLVQHLTISAENYISCWEILTHRYDNRRLQFTSLMNTMQQIPVIKYPNSYNLKRLHDVISESRNGLSNMGIDVSNWGPIIVHYMSQKLDPLTFKEYTQDLKNNRDLPDISEFLSFLENKFIALETVKNCQKESSNSQKPNPTSTFNRHFQKTYNRNIPMKTYNYASNNQKSTLLESNRDHSKIFHTSFGKCPLCEKDHVLMQCDRFIAKDTVQRNNIVTKLNICKNCLYSHGNASCSSQKTCKLCHLKHHTLLHNNELTSKNSIKQKQSTSKQQSSHHLSADIEVLLTTVQIKVQTIDGTYITLRALLDQGSQTNLITEDAAQRLRQPRTKHNALITGIGSTTRDSKGRMSLTCQSIHSDFTFTIDTLILNRLTNNLPTQTFKKMNWTHIENLKLADPEYNISSSIDLLLGADVYADIILDGVFKSDGHAPIAQHTKLGWILCGKLKTVNCHVSIVDLSEISKYWESEDILQGPEDVSQDDECEVLYQNTTKRTSDGKFVVQMPMIDNFETKLGKSRPIATSQFLQLERRLERDERLSHMYKGFINEYCELQHMKTIPRPISYDNKTSPTCYLPHHGVLRESSTTTKLRVVFNASQKTSTGNSLNSLMKKGPNLQKDILTIILKWRTYKYAYTADIEKMYRCIWLDETQHNLMKIIWRNSPTEKLQEYALCTVTYGTKCAPWLALRTLKQLAIEDEYKYPAAAKILKNEFFADDLTSGHNILDFAKQLQTELIALLKGGGMNLRKWSSNTQELLQHLNQDQIAQSTYDFKQEDTKKTLGLGWNPNSDTFTVSWNLENSNKTITKRFLLSQISQLYDPLGWFSPVTITTKLMFQQIWKEKKGWDEPLPEEIQSSWLKLKAELSLLKTIKITRWIGSTEMNVELLGFCDASEKAYACVIYLRAKNEAGQYSITLLTAKTRVAPLSQKITLPRLELCGALLLAQLILKVQESLKDHNITVWAWCDSKVVLAWIQGETTKWERYVENRVAKIKQIIPASQWAYIETKSNPADCATRGVYPSKLINFELWWKGPPILTTFKGKQNQNTNCLFTTNIEKKQEVLIRNKGDNDNLIHNLLNKYSSLTRAKRVLAWIMRFIIIMRRRAMTDIEFDANNSRSYYLTTKELDTSNHMFIKYAQNCDFEVELSLLSKNRSIPIKSVLYKLNPYLDKDGIMRVGGRLNKTNLPLNMKNPVILSRNGRYTLLLIEQAHIATLHGGARLTLAYIRQRYWIVGGNRAVKTQLRHCVRCHRFKTQENFQLMADLPKYRVTPCRPFTHTGVDFTGHVNVKLNRGRGVKTSKGYIAIFVCMTTKAVHIELVSDLSSEMFIAAFQRLCARRGTPTHVYSDCGTNFIGAAKILQSELERFKIELPPEVYEELNNLGVEWHFNAPAWPTAGGLWESAVRSMKYHLRRVMGEQKLTYEELSTLLAKIEACMNSRPLCSLTEDPDEFYSCLTPGHFLTGTPTMLLPISSHEDDKKLNFRQRWRLTEHMFQQFWRTWSSEYLAQLQTRSKWQRSTPNLQKDDVVLIKDNNLPPGKWAMGRIIEVHSGSDNKVRVTSLKTQTGIIKRPVTKLSPLPLREIDTNKEKAIPTPTHNVLKKSFLIMTGILLLFLSLCSGVEGSSTQNSTYITSLGNNRPIYYDNLGDMQLLHDEWKLLLYFNLSTYWDGVQKMEHYLEDTYLLCKRLDPRFCEVTMQQLYHELEVLKHYNTLLLSPHKHLSNRYKRGLINGVGYAANSLFGILDQQFANKYEEDIQALHKNENYLLELIKNQTSIVRFENDILAKNEANIKRQFALINTFMNQTEIKLSKIETAIEATMAANYFSSTSLTAYLLLTNLKNIQEMLFSALTDVYQGHIDVHLLTPVNVINQLNMISGRLPKTLSLPVDNLEQNIKNIYKLLYAKARITGEYFLLEVHIPLASHEDYSLFHIIPLPLRTTQNKTVVVDVSSKYIAFNFGKNTYVSITEERLANCNELSSQHWICNLNLPVQHIENTNAPCESKLLSQQTSSPCNIRNIICEERWIELHTQNTWIALCCDSCTLRTICDKDVTTHVINTSSIVTLKQGCLLQTKTFLIHSRNNYNSKANLELDIQIPLLNTSINAIISTEKTPQLQLLEDRNIDIVKKKLEHIENHEQLPTTITATDLHQFTICYSLLVAAIITLLIWIVKKRGYCARRVKVSTAKEGTQPYEDIELQPYRSRPIQNISRLYSVAERGTKTRPQPGTSAVRPATQAKQCSSKESTNKDVQFYFE